MEVGGELEKVVKKEEKRERKVKSKRKWFAIPIATLTAIVCWMELFLLHVCACWNVDSFRPAIQY